MKEEASEWRQKLNAKVSEIANMENLLEEQQKQLSLAQLRVTQVLQFLSLQRLLYWEGLSRQPAILARSAVAYPAMVRRESVRTAHSRFTKVESLA